ncbi:1-phosphofructokinase [Rhodococcus aerolatus]
MIVTVTPNPSLDRTVELPALVRGEVLRASSSRVDPGGKGVNVARALVAAGEACVAVMPSGGSVGTRIADLLGPQGVPVVSVPVRGSTRCNTALVEPDGTTTKVNEPGPHLSDAEVADLELEVAQLAARAEWVVCAGSLPAGAGVDFHARIVRAAHAAGARVAVDSSGAPMLAAIPAGPDLVKPNLEELAELAGRPLTSLGDVLAAAQELREQGVGAVLVSLGERGALLVDHTGAHHAATPPVPVRSTVGAGDSTLAGFLAAGGSGTEALVTAVAYGAAAVGLPGSVMPGKSDVHPEVVRLSPVLDTSLVLTGEAA